jgi:hypothetical protein
MRVILTLQETAPGQLSVQVHLENLPDMYLAMNMVARAQVALLEKVGQQGTADGRNGAERPVQLYVPAHMASGGD